ncbi:MAG: FeS-binding protein [Armatimonadetes bacterium]|nr:FeS-binding protein [Armatimonadota bacterium]
MARKVWLTFPHDLVERPLIWEVGRKFEVVTNIRQASVSKEVGIVGLELSGEEDEVRQAIAFLTEAGVSVEPVELGVVE